jgi:hypothetical protein
MAQTIATGLRHALMPAAAAATEDTVHGLGLGADD